MRKLGNCKGYKSKNKHQIGVSGQLSAQAVTIFLELGFTGGLRVDEEEVAERGGRLSLGLPDAVGGGVGGRDAPAHPMAVPKGEDILNIWQP